MDKPPKFEKTMTEVLAGLGRIESLRLARNSAREIAPRAKVPVKVMDWRAAVTWRYCELAREAADNLQTNRVAAGTILTRAAMECAVAIWYLYRRIEKTLETSDVDALDSKAMALLLGSKTPGKRDAINVLTLFDDFDKHMKGVGLRRWYEELCEVAHPNWEGTFALFASPNRAERYVEFGSSRCADSVRDGAACALSATISIFEHAHLESGARLPALVVLCEQDIDTRASPKVMLPEEGA